MAANEQTFGAKSDPQVGRTRTGANATNRARPFFMLAVSPIQMTVPWRTSLKRRRVMPDRSQISMNEAQEVRYWTQAIGCSEDELAAAVTRVGSSSDAVRREVYRHW